MDARTLPIIIPLPELSAEDAIELTEFLYELAGRFEASYRGCLLGQTFPSRLIRSG